jgi:prephenate dehydrogenase
VINKLCIVGIGLIGGSLARALRVAGYAHEIVGYGRSVGNLQQAVEFGVIDRAEVSLTEAVRHADMVVLAVPVGCMVEILEEIGPALMDQVVVTDVGSVKGSVIAAARGALGTRFPRFVPGHPLAGTEQSGVAASQADLFQGRRVILSPEPETDATATSSVRDMWVATGAEVATLSAEDHDRILAVSSHLPHMLAYCLMDMVVRHDDHRAILECAAGGFRDATRIAGSDPVMWRDICLANREALLRELKQYADELYILYQVLDRSDTARLEEIFTTASELRAGWTEQ